jgi:hypothetical protein
MTGPAADAARYAATILTPDLGPDLPAEVEAALADRGLNVPHSRQNIAASPTTPMARP